jgi:hypothetical protein
MSVSPSSGSEIEEAILDDVGGSDVSSDAVRDAFAPDAPSAETRPGGESGSGASEEAYSDDFGSGDDRVSEDGVFLNEPVDDAPESPAAEAPSHHGAFATRADPSTSDEKHPDAHSAEHRRAPRASSSSFAAAPARTAAGTRARDARGADASAGSESADREAERSDASSPKVFRWERSRSPSPDRVARLAARTKTSSRNEPEWASVPGRVAALVARARAVSARREVVAAMSPAARAARRYENDPAPVIVPALTMAKARAQRAAAALRAEAEAVRASVAAHAAAHRERVTPDLARVMYVRRAITRAAALDGARVVEELERETKSKSRGDAGAFGKTSSTLEVLRAAVGARGDGDGDDARFGKSHPVTFGTYSPIGKGKQTLLRRLWASHRLRRAAAECLGGDAAEPVDAPREWAELQLGSASGGANDWYDEASGGFGEGLDSFAHLDGSEEGKNAVSVLRASAELRRRAGGVLAP